MKLIFRKSLLPILVIIILSAGIFFFRPSEIPPLFFDEGWTLSVVRNCIETGQYSRLLVGEPVSGGAVVKPLSVTGPIALSFKLLGVGIWQGRLPSMFFIGLSFLFLFVLCRKLFNPSIAFLTLFVAILMPGITHPLIIGRQAIGEAPMVFFLLGGYIFLFSFLNGNLYSILGIIVIWGLALESKGHVLPFWLVSIIVPIFVAYIYKQWSYLKKLVVVLISPLPVYFILYGIQYYLGKNLPTYEGIHDFFTLRTITLVPSVRLSTLILVFIIGVPTIIGLIYGVRQCWFDMKGKGWNHADFYVRLSLLSLLISWFLWYLFFSLGWPRYFFPISFIGSIFVARWLFNIVGDFKSLFSRKLNIFPRIKLYFVIFFIIMVASTSIVFLRSAVIQGNDDAVKVIEFIEQTIGKSAVIETYEYELMFLLDNPYHFPPDQTEVELNRRYFLGQAIEISYDPSDYKYDYLIVGPISTMWQLYTPTIDQGNFQLIKEIGEYKIYQKLP